MKNLALARIRELEPYRPPIDGRDEYGGLLLDFNERTTGAADRLYPEYGDITRAVTAYAAAKDAQVMLTNGTDQAIDVILRTFSDKGDEVIIPEPTFAMYAQYARVNGCRVVSPRFAENGAAWPLEAVLNALSGSTKVIVVCNPNNPTGALLAAADIARLARQARDSVVYIDEAYYEFSGVTVAQLIAEYPNIIVSRTFSKAFGLAGLRIGYVLARPEYIAEMLKVRGPYDINRPACRAATRALADVADMRRYVREVMQESRPLLERFFSERDVPFYPPRGNFILFQPPDAPDAPAVAAALRSAGVAVRLQHKPGVENMLRVTIGTKRQMRAFMRAYDAVAGTAGVRGRKRAYAFIDRDGTIISEPQDDFQVDRLDKLRLLDGAVEGLQALKNRGYRLVMVSNQNGIGTDSFPQVDFDRPQNALLKTLRRAGVTFDEVFVCPHLPEADCACRKPKTGLLDDWLKTAAVDTDRSFVVGDRQTDRQFAGNLGVRYVPMTTNGNFINALKKETLL